MTELSDEQIEALCEAATKGPWEIFRYGNGGGRIHVSGEDGRKRELIADMERDGDVTAYNEGDREFLFAARTLVPSLLERARKAEAENRRLIAERAANEKANIESRRSICEQSDRYKAERDDLRDGNQAIVETCERIALERDEWKREAVRSRAVLATFAADLDEQAAKLRAVEALHEEWGRHGLDEPYFELWKRLGITLFADTTPEATR